MCAGRCWRLSAGAALVLAVLANCPRIGMAANPVGEEAFFDELPSIVTVTRLKQSPLELPAAVTIIDRTMIEASGVVDIPGLLRLAAGFQVGHPFGTRTTVTYHGMTNEYAQRMQVLVDGRSVYSPVFGGVEWPLLPLALEDIERIEVTRGPNGVTYGANSFLGVINIITTHPGGFAEHAYTKVIGDTAGDFQKVLLRQGGSSGDLNYYLTLEHRWDAGLDDSVPNGTHQEFDESRINQMRFSSEYRAGINDYLALQFGVDDAQLGQGKYNDPVSQARVSDNLAHFQQIGWRHEAGSQQETQLLFYHEYTDLQNEMETAPLSTIFNATPEQVQALLGVPDQPVAGNFGNTSERYNLELQHRYGITPTLRAVSGGEARLDRVRAPGLLEFDDWNDAYLYRLFTNGEWRTTPHWLVNSGAMIEYSKGVGSLVSPRLAVNYLLNQEQAIRASYTRAYRTPSLIEQHAYMTTTLAEDGGVVDEMLKSRGGLEPERMDAWELGLAGDHHGGLGYDLKLFREKLTGLITMASEYNPSEPYCGIVNLKDLCRVDSYSNSGEVVLSGAELQFGYRPDTTRLITLAWSHFFQREGEILFSRSDSGAKYHGIEAWVPEDTATLLAQQGLGNGLSLSVMLHHVDSWMSAGKTNDVRFTTANARLSKHFKVAGNDAAFAFGVNDLLGSYYDFFYFSPTTPRAYVSMELAF